MDSGPVTAAFFAHAEGWGDWYVGSDFFANIPAGGSVQATTVWDTTGFSGTVPVKVVVNPYGRVAESNVSNNVASTSVIVLPPPPPPVPDFTAVPVTGTLPLTVQFTDTSTSDVPITAWAWDFGDGGTSDQQHPSHTYTAAGVYTVTLTVTAASGGNTKMRANFIAVSTPPPPIPDFGASATAGRPPLTVHFTDLSTDATSWLWDFGDGGSSTARNPDHDYVATGVYTVTLTASGPGGTAAKAVPGLITVGPAEVSFDLPLVPGWNLVSIPVQPANASASSLFAPIAGGLTIVYAYQGCDTADPWKKYDPAALPFSNDLTNVDNKLGLWVLATMTDTLSIAGMPPGAVDIPLCVGWNLAGYPAMQAAAPATLFAPIAGCYSIVFAYRATDAADPWKKYDPAALPFSNDLQQVLPGDGLWILATQACTWPVGGP